MEYLFTCGYLLENMDVGYYLYGKKDRVEKYIKNRWGRQPFGYNDENTYNNIFTMMDSVNYWKNEIQKMDSFREVYFIKIK